MMLLKSPQGHLMVVRSGAQAESRMGLVLGVGVGVCFPTQRWGCHLLPMGESVGQEEPEAVCYLKSLPVPLFMPDCVAPSVSA